MLDPIEVPSESEAGPCLYPIFHNDIKEEDVIKGCDEEEEVDEDFDEGAFFSWNNPDLVRTMGDLSVMCFSLPPCGQVTPPLW